MRFAVALILLLLSQSLYSQSILQLRTLPANPSMTDSVVVLADLEFRSTGCQLDQKNLTVSGNTISATAHHCVGLAAAICYVTDTFRLGRLNSGSYTFTLALSRSGGSVPCAPSLTVNDRDTLNFTVQSALGLKNYEQRVYSVYPNPVSDYLSVSKSFGLKAERIIIRSQLGSVVLETEQTTEPIAVSGLSSGIYYLEIIHKSGRTVEKFIKE